MDEILLSLLMRFISSRRLLKNNKKTRNSVETAKSSGAIHLCVAVFSFTPDGLRLNALAHLFLKNLFSMAFKIQK